MARKGQRPAVCKIENCNIPLYKYHDETLNVKSENNCFKSVIGEHLECSGEDIPSSMTFLFNFWHNLRGFLENLLRAFKVMDVLSARLSSPLYLHSNQKHPFSFLMHIFSINMKRETMEEHK